MPLPVDLTLITVTGTFQYLSGVSMAGQRITFVPQFDGAVVDTTSNVILGGVTISAILDEAGSFTVQLPATDDPHLTPNGFTYLVIEPSASGRVYEMVVPVATPNAHLNLAQATPINLNDVTVGGVTGDLRLDVVSGTYYFA